LIGLFGGFYIVPLYALIQTRSEKSHQSRVIAANNILNALFMVVSAGVSMLLFSFGLTIPQLFLATALFNAVVAIYIYRLVPEFLIRFIVWILVHSVYQLKIRNIDRIPDEGAALIVCNHVSYVDALVITAACRRPIRFVIDQRFFDKPVLSFVFKAGRAIPLIVGADDRSPAEQTFGDISAALAAGELVAIFPEGPISEDGELRPFQHWINRIYLENPVPIVPVALSGLWGSVFSRRDGSVLRRLVKLRPFRMIAIEAGHPVAAASADPESLRHEVLTLRQPS
jgi:1-acyl-sn-glycerol-3-phosphate acyltransferase